MHPPIGPVRAIKWTNLLFFIVTTLLAFASPFYIIHHGLSAVSVILFVIYTIATGLGITVGYHRLFAHVTYKANPVVQFFLLFFGAAAFEQSALKWASQHRDHHLYVDTEKDPYSIKKGFWYAHIGWLVFWKHTAHYDNVKDLSANRLIHNQHQFYILWAVVSGILTPILIGGLFGDWMGAFLLAVCARLTLVYHSTFCINSVCHKMGAATYDIDATARDHWFVALLTFGEGYHNFHHRFPSDYRNGVRWYHWDPSKWLINLLSRCGFVWDLKRVPHFRILQARLSAENQKVSALIAAKIHEQHPAALQHKETLSHRYTKIRAQLNAFESAASDYQSLLKEAASRKSEDFKRLKLAAFENFKLNRVRFKSSYREWKAYASSLYFSHKAF